MVDAVPIRSNRMTEGDYERERAALGLTRHEAVTRWEQDLARLFSRSGWTQEELAKKEAKSQSWIAYQLRFGRFIDFTTIVVKLDSPPFWLNENRFRKYWAKTDKADGNERTRFQQTWDLLQANLKPQESQAPHRKIGRAIVDLFADAKWHRVDEIIAEIDAPAEQVGTVLENMRTKKTYNCEAKRKGHGAETQYRICRMDRETVSLMLIRQELGPIIETLKAEGRKTMARYSPGTVATMAARLKTLLDQWGE